jgi:thioredoxin reductase
MELYDCIIVGGGPAGLNAAVVLGRCRRKVLVFDTETYRNRKSHGMHNYLTRDDILPPDFISISQQELLKYSVQKVKRTIVNARKNAEGVFLVKDENGTVYGAKKLLVATGLSDLVPRIKGFDECYGKSVFHCPYCDGWEVRDRKLGVYARNKNGTELALALTAWSPTVTLFTDGKKFKLKSGEKESLQANGVEVVNTSIGSLRHNEGQMEAVVFSDATEKPCDALFFVNGYNQQCDIAEAFGCKVSKKGVIETNKHQQTNIEGLYVAGDASKDMHFVVVAAAEGAKAAVTINKELIKETVEKRVDG